jgi:hypothetical protein
MALPVLLNNFKFRNFFGVRIPIENIIAPTTSLISCDVFESNNSGERRNFPWALELQYSSFEILVVDSNAMLEIFVIDVDNEFVPPPKNF